MSPEELRAAISREIPVLANAPCHVPAKGTRAHVLIFENAVFKGPRDDAQNPYIQQEYKILRHLAGRGLPVPQVTHVGKDAVFFGMTRLEGEVLTRGVFDNMSKEIRAQFTGDLAAFMTGLAAAFTPQEAKEMVRYTGEYTFKEMTLETALAAPAVQALLPEIESAIAEYSKIAASNPPVVFHDDFHMGNILVKNSRLSGVIDFGYMNTGMPEEGMFSWGRAWPDFTFDLCMQYSRRTGSPVSYRNYLLCNLVAKVKSIAAGQDVKDSTERIRDILVLL